MFTEAFPKLVLITPKFYILSTVLILFLSHKKIVLIHREGTRQSDIISATNRMQLLFLWHLNDNVKCNKCRINIFD